MTSKKPIKGLLAGCPEGSRQSFEEIDEGGILKIQVDRKDREGRVWWVFFFSDFNSMCVCVLVFFPMGANVGSTHSYQLVAPGLF